MTRRHARAARGGRAGARADGFTLVEVLVALVVFMTGITGILALLSTGVVLHRQGLDAVRTVHHVEDVVAALRRELVTDALYDPAERRWAGLRTGFDTRTGRFVELERVADDPALVAVAVELVAEEGNEREGTLLARVRIHPRVRELDEVAPIPYLLQPGPTVAEALSAPAPSTPDPSTRDPSTPDPSAPDPSAPDPGDR